MKKILLLLLVFAGFTACENDALEELPTEMNISEDIVSKKNQKIDVCHKGKIINISINAVKAHQGHGDAIDLDGDGYFDIENDCTEGIDCDDTNAAINPGMEEICNDSLDNNCDGLTDNEDTMCYEIGDCRDGGVVFYLAGENEDLNSDGHPDLGFIVALEDQGTAPWTSDTDTLEEIGVNNYDLGFGFYNTMTVIDSQGNGTDHAAGLARAYSGFGYTDWFLPSGGEMNALYEALEIVNPAIIDCGGDILSSIYWTSSEEGDDDATDTTFDPFSQTTSNKRSTFYIRAIRVF